MINNDGEKGCLNQCIRMEETPRKKTGKHGEMSGVLEFKYCKEKGPIPTNCWKWVMFFFWGSKRFEAQFNMPCNISIL